MFSAEVVGTRAAPEPCADRRRSLFFFYFVFVPFCSNVSGLFRCCLPPFFLLRSRVFERSQILVGLPVGANVFLGGTFSGTIIHFSASLLPRLGGVKVDCCVPVLRLCVWDSKVNLLLYFILPDASPLSLSGTFLPSFLATGTTVLRAVRAGSKKQPGVRMGRVLRPTQPQRQALISKRPRAGGSGGGRG